MKVWVLLLLCWWIVPPPVAVQAEESAEQKKLLPIGKEELLALFKKEKAVEKRTVQGPDIIEIIEEDPKVAIRIKDSVIEGGLDFTTLPKTPKEKVELPESWSDEQKKKWKDLHSANISVITTIIAITNTKILPELPTDKSFPPLAVVVMDVFFKYGLDFSGATFSGEAVFLGTTFSGEADFAEATFDQLVSFQEARFSASLTLNSARFKSFVDFRSSKIQQLNFDNPIPLIVEGRVDFRGATFEEAHLQEIVFTQDVDFSDASFGIPVSSQGDSSIVFRFVTFEGNAYFLRAKFSGRTSLERVNFQKEADFTDADFRNEYSSDAFSLSYLRFSNLRLSFDQLPLPEAWVKEDAKRVKSFVDLESEKSKPTSSASQELQPVSNVLKSLEQHFRRQEQLQDANNAHYHFKLAEFQETQAKEGKWSGEWLELMGEWVLWGWPFAYGTGFKQTVAWTFGVNILFALIYSTAGTLQRADESFATRDFVLKVRLLDYYKYYLPKDENHAIQLVEGEGASAPRSSVGSVFWTFWNALWLSTPCCLQLPCGSWELFLIIQGNC